MAVAAATHAIGTGTSLAIARPGAADATGCLIVVATSSISDKGYAPYPSGFTQWYNYAINRVASDGHYVVTHLSARKGTAAETATYVCVMSSGTSAKCAIAAAAYRVTDPLDAAILANNIGGYNYKNSTVSGTVYAPSLSLVGNGSIVLDVGAMLAATSAHAASLKLRTGDTTALIDKQQETDSGGYFLAASHGYREAQTGVLTQESLAVTGNLGFMGISFEVRQSAASGGGPPLPPFATVGRTVYIGA